MKKYLYIKALLNLRKYLNELIDQEILRVSDRAGDSKKFKDVFFL